MLYVVVQKDNENKYDTLVGIFPCRFDAEDFSRGLFSTEVYQIVEVEGHWGDLMNIRKAAGC
jgi:hypothetical protein